MSVQVDTLWQLKLTAGPRQVFCALMGTATRNGRLLAVENFGMALTFAPSGTSFRRCSPLRATVDSCGDGTLLRFSPAHQDDRTEDIAAQAESVGSLIHQLRQSMGTSAA